MVGFGDADSYYASAEVARRPWLSGLPVGVLGNQGACVIARNYPMKAFGVKVGEPVWEAKVKCPDGIYVKRDFRWYETLSRKMLDAIKAFSPRVEYFSIDEFFWQAEPLRDRNYHQAAEVIRDHVKREVGVPMTVAFARTRTLAKLFADAAKPFGALAVTDPAEERERLARLPVTEIAGIAKRHAARLAPYGIKSCLDLASANGPFIKKLLTAVGHDLWMELNGIPATPIRPARTPHKMIARGGSLAGRVRDAHTLYGWLRSNFPRVEAVILDFYHAAEHLGDWAKALFPDDEGRAGRVAQKWCHRLKHAGGAAVLAALREVDVSGRSALAREAHRRLLVYLENQVHRMDYPHYRSKGWLIGSGPVGAACKQVVGQRLKGSGMRWGEVGADALCHLRALFRSEKSSGTPTGTPKPRKNYRHKRRLPHTDRSRAAQKNPHPTGHAPALSSPREEQTVPTL